MVRLFELHGTVGDIGGGGDRTGGRLRWAIQHPEDQNQEHGAEREEEAEITLPLDSPDANAVWAVHGEMKAEIPPGKS